MGTGEEPYRMREAVSMALREMFLQGDPPVRKVRWAGEDIKAREDTRRVVAGGVEGLEGAAAT